MGRRTHAKPRHAGRRKTSRRSEAGEGWLGSGGADDPSRPRYLARLRQTTVADDRLTVHEGPLNAAGPRDVAGPAVRHVVHDLFLMAGDSVRREDGDVPGQPGGEPPSGQNADA